MFLKSFVRDLFGRLNFKMPFTLLHLGPALALGLPLRGYFHAPTFIIASLILDIEPLLVLVFGLSYPLHGLFHTFLVALLVGLVISYLMFLLEGALSFVYQALLLETDKKMGLKSFVIAGTAGTLLHVLLDSPLYSDIQPFYPLQINPFYNPALSQVIYDVCLWSFIFGIIYYTYLIVKHKRKRSI
jgi:hypothetical protein